MTIDPLELSRDLIRCPSVTPEDAGVLSVLEAALAPLGFRIWRQTFSHPGEAEVENLYARIGEKGPNFCFGGHTDVVPVGDRDAWSFDPFGAEIHDGRLFGRGAVDMKTAVACFAAAASRFLARHGKDFGGSISMLITNDEEGPSINGTAKMLRWIAERGERLDASLVGEPTNVRELGDMAKIGRRGNFDGVLTVYGVQGHSAYPHLADNPMPRLAKMALALSEKPFDEGSEHFQPTNLQVTTIDVGNPAHNVIPAQGRLKFNIRFSNLQTPESLEREVRARLDAVGGRYDLTTRCGGHSFLTEPGAFTDMVAASIRRHTTRTPELTTTGGTSDAQFFKNYCPVIEFGLVGQTMHKVDENCPLEHIAALAEVYLAILEDYFRVK